MTGDFVSFQLTPLVIAMPGPMAEALGWPEEPLGFADILALSQDPEGWAAYGHPEWGEFRLGKTNPNFSTSGLSALIGQAYAANAKTEGLSLEDLAKPTTDEFARQIESAVVHYGDTTLTFLNNWYRADQRGNPYGYVSAVAVEEKSVLDYNSGNPDGVLQEGEEPRPPRVPLVAIYPEEGTLYSDNPLYVLDADWVDDDEAAGAQQFIDFLGQPENQEQILRYGFRPGNPDVAIDDPIDPSNGVDPDATADAPRGARAGGAGPAPRRLAGPAQAGPRPPADGRLRIHGEHRRSGDGRDQARPRQAGDGDGARPVQRRRRGRPLGVQHRSRRPR